MLRTILVVDDIMSNRLILKEILKKEYAVLEASSGEEALGILNRRHDTISAVLLDISMPGINGFEVLTIIRATKKLSEIPVIMITGSGDKESRIRSLSLGANDYVIKPYSSEIIKHCLQNNIAFHEAATRVSAMRRDKLTGLHTRESFFDKVQELVFEHEPGYYIMTCFDIDKFKVINDQYGMQKGDEVLQHVAEVFREGFEPNGGICSRISADNYAVLYPVAFQSSLEIEAIREKAAHIDGLAAPINFCIGRYLIVDKNIPPAVMYDRAMLASASIKGRYDEKIAIYTDAMRERLIREQQIVLEMEDALNTRQFEVWFQPQFNYSTGAIVGAEALVRWQHPQKGLVMPNDFIGLFEQNGFIYALDKFVWEEVCVFLRKWIDNGRTPLPISVNISRYDVFRPDIVDVITGLVKKYDLPLNLLRLEITESAFSEASQHIVSVIKKLLQCGFTVEIDDFGSGYSSLNTLKDVPAQIIKLDMKFLESSDDSKRGGNIIESVVRMAKWLGMSVIAEGVETFEQANFLRSIGCCYMQGYLYAKPMPAKEYEEYHIGIEKEEHLLTLETVENLDNNSFWDPKSMDTLIFNSYVGGACIFEYNKGSIELLRANEKYAQVIGSAGMTVEDALKLSWAEHLDDENRKHVIADLNESITTKKEVTGEYVFLDLPGCPHETFLRSTMRVIATSGERHLVYCTNENITAQRQAESREELSAKQLNAIMGNINGGVTASIIEGNKYRRLFANETYYKQRGYSKEQYEALFDGLPGCILPEDQDAVLEQEKVLCVSRESGSIEFRIKRADGKIRRIKSNISIVDYPGEDMPVLLAVSSDVTEQREIEIRALRMSEQLKAIMDNIDLGILAAMVEGKSAKSIFANDRYYDMLGYTKEQFEEEIQSAYQTIASKDLDRVMEATAKINTTGESTVLIYNAVTRDGRERVFRAIISLGHFTGIDKPIQFTILRDITEEMEIEQRERLALEQLKSMMNDMPGGFVRMRVYDDGSIKPVYINDGFLNLTSMSHDEALMLYSDDALKGVHPDDVFIVNEAIAKMFKNGEAHSSRYRLISGNGGYIWLSIFGRITKNISGDTYLNIYYTDASEQVREEETQKDLLDNLPGGAGIYELKDGQITLTYQNKSYWELVGLNKIDFLDSTPMSAIHPDDVSLIFRELSSAIEQDRDVVCDIRLRHLTKGYRLVHLVGRVVRKETGGYMIYTTFSLIDADGMSYQQMLPVVLSAIMESTSDLSFAKNANFRYLTCSRAFALMSGKSSVQDIIGKTDYDLFEKDLADKFRHDDEELLRSKKAIIDMKESIPSADGSPRYSSTSKYVLCDGSGAIIGLYGVGRDITKNIVQENQLSLVNNNIPGGLVTYAYREGSLHITYCNDGFCKLFGGTREGFEARGDFDPIEWVFEEDRDALMRQIVALVQNNIPMDLIFRIHVIGGSYKWISEKAITAERNGDTVSFNAILLDVTESQNVNEQLRISEEENHLAVALGRSIVMRYIIADKSLHLSPEIAAAYSLPEKITDVPYEPVRRGLISSESENAYIGFFEAILNGSEAGTVLYQQRFLGSWRWMEAKSSTIFANDGKPVKAIISLLDITEQIEKETIYKKWQHSLQDRAQESYTLFRCNLNRNTSYDTKEGTLISFRFDSAGVTFNERARAYVKQCVLPEDADRYLAFTNSDAMLAGYYRGKRSATLEYRELLANGVTRWLLLTVDLVEFPNSTDVEAYLMYEDIDEAKKSELQTKELSETDPLTGILNRVTFTSKVDSVLRTSEPEKRHALLMLDIDNFKKVNDVFGHIAGDKALIDLSSGLRSMMRHDDLVARLGGDEFVVFLQNVLDENAVISKAKQICSIARKSYSMEVQISASVGIAFSPRDGMSFDLLYKKADSALYYVKGSQKGNYAVYHDKMADEHLEPEPDTLDSSGIMIADKKRRMLIVDDDNIDHAMLQSLFHNEFIVEKAQDGQTALIRLRHYGSAISVVLLDLIMPGMDGFAVLESMKESPELRSIPVIIVSGDESRETCLKAIRKGATDFVTKPVDADLLRIRVHSAISKCENERLRAKNSLLEIQNEERIRYECALESTGITYVEFNWVTGKFNYYSSISKYLLGTYDDRPFWQILLCDIVADTKTVKGMQQLVHRLADNVTQTSASKIVELKTPSGIIHSFRMTARKVVNSYQFTGSVIITLNDLEYEVSDDS